MPASKEVIATPIEVMHACRGHTSDTTTLKADMISVGHNLTSVDTLSFVVAGNMTFVGANIS